MKHTNEEQNDPINANTMSISGTNKAITVARPTKIVVLIKIPSFEVELLEKIKASIVNLKGNTLIGNASITVRPTEI